MRLILGNLDEIRIQSVGGYLTPMFRVKEDNEAGHDFNVSQISDGTLRVLGLLLALYQSPRPDIIALEEPELTVNPGVLRMLVESIREASEASQIILTTHSPELVDMLNPEEVRAVELEGGKTIVNPVAQSQLRAVKENLFTLGQIMVSEGISG
jgi:predicted ATPase